MLEYETLNAKMERPSEADALAASLAEVQEKLCNAGSASSCAGMGDIERACALGHSISCAAVEEDAIDGP